MVAPFALSCNYNPELLDYAGVAGFRIRVYETTPSGRAPPEGEGTQRRRFTFQKMHKS